MSYTCTCCGQTHDDLADVVFDEPVFVQSIPEEERADRVRLDDDLCVIDDAEHFIRGVIEIPIHGQAETFGIGVWVSQKRENFDTYVDHFQSAEIGPFFGWLSNEFFFGGQSTRSVKTMAHFRGDGLRPSIQLEPTEHPLSVAQRDGTSLDDVWRFVHEHLGRSAT